MTYMAPRRAVRQHPRAELSGTTLKYWMPSKSTRASAPFDRVHWPSLSPRYKADALSTSSRPLLLLFERFFSPLVSLNPLLLV